MAYRFVDTNMKRTIETVINETFPNMIDRDRRMINRYYSAFIETLAHNFKLLDKTHSTDSDMQVTYNREEFTRDNNLNLKWILTCLLPFISESNGKTMKDIKSLSDIYTHKTESVDINKKSPKYTYSNIQYGRCNRDDKNNIKEIPFSEEHIRDNYYLLVDTLRECSFKMHCNWKDVLPYTKQELSKSTLYLESFRNYRNGSFADWDPYDVCRPELLDTDQGVEKLRLSTRGLYIGIIYDTISNLLYEPVLDIKWMIYDIPVAPSGSYASGRVPMIVMLDDYLDLSSILRYHKKVSWKELDSKDQAQFTRRWETIRDAAINKTDVSTQGRYVINPKYFAMMIKSLMIGFNYFNKKLGKATREGYVKFEKDARIQKLLDEEDLRLSEIDINYFVSSMKSVKPSHIYDYLVDCIFKLKQTYYSSHYIMDRKKQSFNREDKFVINSKMDTKVGDNVFITMKNLYNYSKSIIRDDTETREYKRLPRYWKNLTSAQRQKFIDRFNGKDSGWYSVTRYVSTYVVGAGIEYNKYDDMDEGTKRTVSRAINTSMGELLRDIYLEIVFSVLIFGGILTYPKFTPQEEIDVDRVFAQNRQNDNWNFAYHFLTGRPYSHTGEYAFYGYDSPTNVFEVNRTIQKKYRWYERVSVHWIAQLGLCHKIVHQRVHYITGGTGIGKSSVVPILYMYYLKAIDYNLQGHVVCTQPRISPTEGSARNTSSQVGLPITADDKTYDDNNFNFQMSYQGKKHVFDYECLSLKFCTDGSLLADLSNPMLKDYIGRDKRLFTNDNMYDVVIIDEAHEHNANMDIILSLMRNIAHFNNSIRLVIMSATIEDDEPTYRRYYRNINDNRKYPLDRWIEQHKIDRVNVDRRLHIARPGSDTRYHIEDVYHPGVDPDQLTCKIILTSQSGHVLLFRPGQADIRKSIEFINSKTPSNVIALPFYAGLSEESKKFIQDVNAQLYRLRISKTDDFDDKARNGRLSDGTNSYTRVVIVATNIAEASITIDNLVYVVETGEQKKSKYDHRVRAAVLRSVGINESSRLQRRGRVGRTSPGEAHYTYEKDAMKYNKFMFDIATSDMSSNILSQMMNDTNEPPFVDVDVNSVTAPRLNRLKKGFDVILNNHYFIDGRYYSYIGNPSHYDYNNYEECAIYHSTGYKNSDVLDPRGKFYIIHPDELEFNRNINGEIVEKLSDDVEIVHMKKTFNMIRSKKMRSFLDKLLKSMLIAFKGDVTVKTSIGRYITAIKDTLSKNIEQLDMGDALMLIYSTVFGCRDEMIRYISFKLALMRESIVSIGTMGKPKIAIVNGLRRIVKDKSSDILSMVELSKRIDMILQSLKVSIDHKDERCLVEMKGNNREMIKRVFTTDEEMDRRDGKVLEDYLNCVYDRFTDTIENRLPNQFIKLCDNSGINETVAYNYCRNYMMLNQQILMLRVKDDKSDTLTLDELAQILSPIKNVAHPGSSPMTNCILLSKPYNLVKFVSGSDNTYIDVFNPGIDSAKEFAFANINRTVPDSLMDPAYRKSYVFYDSYDIIRNDIKICHYVRPSDLQIISHIYTLYEITDRYNSEMTVKKDITWNDIKAKNNYTKTFNNIYSDLSRNRNTRIWSILPTIDESLSEYSKIMSMYERHGSTTSITVNV